MAALWYIVTVLMLAKYVFATECPRETNILNCDDCIRCGGSWCSGKEDNHCDYNPTDKWCPLHKETASYKLQNKDDIHEAFLEKLNSEEELAVQIPGMASQLEGQNIELEVSSFKHGIGALKKYVSVSHNRPMCEKNSCTLIVSAEVSEEVCHHQQNVTYEVVDINVKINNATQKLIKLYVSCRCECSRRAERKSYRCLGRGTYSCGVCICQPGWTGESCEIPDEASCGERDNNGNRGDINDRCSTPNGVCYGNGICGPCETCVCNHEGHGSQYLDENNLCEDICAMTSPCSLCILENKPGKCDKCELPLIVNPYNKTLLDLTDNYNRAVWVTCNVTMKDYSIEYVTMMEEYYIYVMRLQLENEKHYGVVASPASWIVPLVVIATLLAAAAVGVIWWKNHTVPLPLNSPDYDHIDAEDCIQENPLYKPPMSSYKNPLYNKE